MDQHEIYKAIPKATKFDYVCALCFCVQGFLHVLVLSDISIFNAYKLFTDLNQSNNLSGFPLKSRHTCSIKGHRPWKPVAQDLRLSMSNGSN